MSKHMKKFISVLLASAMLISSFGLIATAEEDTTTTAVTTAETTTEQVDSYYEEAIGLLANMNIFQGYEDGSFKPETTITRAEFSAVILRTLNMNTTTPYAGIFTDVASTHWAATVIQTASDAGIINGMGDGTFAPDAPVTYDQAIKMIVCALNYGAYAQANGGFPTGYIAVASDKSVGITKNASGSVGQEVTRGTVAKMIYNALNADYPTVTGYENGEPQYTKKDGKTLASEKQKVYSIEGVVTATNTMSIDSSAIPTATQVVIDGKYYENNIDNANDLVATYVKAYYYDYDGNGNDMTLLYAIPLSGKNKTVTIQDKDIDVITNVNTAGTACQVSYFAQNGSTKTYKLAQQPIVVYNGKLFVPTDADLNVYDEAGVKTGTMTLEEYLKPQVGSIKLSDYNNDGTYDIMAVQAYETYVVTSANDSTILAKYGKKLDVSNDDLEKIITVTKNGNETKPRNLKKMDVITVLSSINSNGDKVIAVEANAKTAKGTIKSLDTDKDRTYIVVNDTNYEVDINAIPDVKVGAEVTCYLDKFGRVAYIESSASGNLASGEEYGVLVTVYKDDSGEDTLVKLFTDDGKVLAAKASTSMDFIGWVGTGDDYQTSPQYQQMTLNANTEEDYKKLVAANSNVVVNTGKAVSTNNVIEYQFPIKIVKYKLNSANELTLLYQTTTNSSSEIGVVFDGSNLRGATGAGTILGNRYNLSDKAVRFVVPKLEADISNTSVYQAGNVIPSNYINKDGISKDFKVGEVEDNATIGLLVEYVDGNDRIAKDDTYGSADNVSWGLITRIAQGIDDDDNVVYNITMNTNGNETMYTTSSNATLAYTTGFGNSDGYATVKLWDGVSGSADGGANDINRFIGVGDICGVKVSGNEINTMLRMLDMSEYIAWSADLTNYTTEGVLKTPSAIVTFLKNRTSYNASTRDGGLLGKVIGINTDNGYMIQVQYADGTQTLVTPSATTPCPIYFADQKKVKTYTASDLQEGDYVVVRDFRAAFSQIIGIRLGE